MKRILLFVFSFILIASILTAKDKKKTAKSPKTTDSTAVSKVALSEKKQADGPIDFTKKPEPLEAKSFVFPDFKESKLNNGIKVFIVKDDEEPTVSIRLLIPGGSTMDGEKTGLADFTTDMLTKGAGKRNSLQIAQALDGVGADVAANTTNDYISVNLSCLKKHLKLTLDIFADVILNPTFPQDEFDKLIPQKLQGLKQQKSSPGAIAGNMARMVIYGDMHPYGKFQTEESVKSIKLDDIKAYYRAVFKPNEASIIVVGDVVEDEIIKQLNSALDTWKPGQKGSITMPNPQPMPIGVYFVNRPGSVQSTVLVTTSAVPYSDENYELISLGSSIMGGGFGSRLFRNLREKYSYTYSPNTTLTGLKYANRFSCNSDVRNSVTDSAITVVLDLLKDLSENPSPPDEINRIKRYRVGQYLMSFENSSFLASLIQNADFMGTPLEKLKTYHERYLSYSPFQVQRVADKFMNPMFAHIIVVGNPDVKSKLEKFGKVFEYDLDLKPLTGEKGKFEKLSMEPQDLTRKYMQAIGGKDAVGRITTMLINSKAVITTQGQNIDGIIIQKFKYPNKMNQVVDMKMVQQSTWCDGKDLWIKDMSGINKKDGEELEKGIFDATLFNIAKIVDMGYKCNVLGKQGSDIVMKTVSPKGIDRTLYFDGSSFLLTKVESNIKTQNGPMPVTELYSDYIDVGGIKLPKTITSTNPYFTSKVDNEYKLNQPFDDKEFQPTDK